MKKRLHILMCFCIYLMISQYESSAQYLPVKKNWGATFGANGLSVLNLDAHTAPSGSLLFRYYFMDCASYRLGFNPRLYRSFNTIDMGTQYQELTVREKGLELSLGYQNNFIGTERLNPYAGADLVLGTARTNTNTFTYAVDEDNNQNLDEPWTEDEVIGAKLMWFALRPFIGFEYFVAPKFALGGEFGYDIRYQRTGPYKLTSTVFDGEDEETEVFEGLPAKEFNMGGQAVALFTFSYYFMKRCCDDEMNLR